MALTWGMFCVRLLLPLQTLISFDMAKVARSVGLSGSVDENDLSISIIPEVLLQNDPQKTKH